MKLGAIIIAAGKEANPMLPCGDKLPLFLDGDSSAPGEAAEVL